MREIKFRVWGLEENKWVNLDGIPEKDYTYQFVGKGKKFPYKQIFGLENFAKYQKGWHWMQYTGLKDKNGKEIYEGDIVIGGMNYSGEQFYKGYIHWFADGAEYWALADFSEFGGKWNDRFTKLVEGIDEDDDSTETDTLEIIGNIYENPELIK